MMMIMMMTVIQDDYGVYSLGVACVEASSESTPRT